MAKRSDAGAERRSREFWVGIARGFGGAIFFSLPLLMTMEMWWLGFYMDRLRLALFMVLMFPMLVGLSHFSGFEETLRWRDDVADACVAYGIGIVSSVAVLSLFAIIDTGMPVHEVVGKIAVESVPASFGAILARSELRGPRTGQQPPSESPTEERKEHAGYGAELFFMTAGAIFFAFNVAPTEEMVFLAAKMTPWHAIALAVASILMMHAFVYAVDFKGQALIPPGTPWWSMFLRFTTVGYVLALLMSAYVLWTFGRYDAAGSSAVVQAAIVLAFPASLGAAAARLIL